MIGNGEMAAMTSDVSYSRSRRRRARCTMISNHRCFNIFIATLSWGATYSMALMCSLRHPSRPVLSSAFNLVRHQNANKNRGHSRLRQMPSLSARNDLNDEFNDEYKDNVGSDQYYQSIISNAMEEEKLKSLPKRSNADTTTNINQDTTLEETKRMMEQQQQQINMLMKLVQNQQQQPGKSAFTQKQRKSINVAPLRVMFFIDGTWLYYSLHARKGERCAATQKFGKGWQANYKVDWMALPRLICNEIEKQRGSQVSSSFNKLCVSVGFECTNDHHLLFKKSFKGSDRPLDITRVSVFTSAKKETGMLHNTLHVACIPT